MAGMKVSLIMLPKGVDPADLAVSNEQQLRQLIEKPQSIIRALIKRLEGSKGKDVESCLDELLPIVKAVANPVYLGEMVQEIAQILHVPEYMVIAKLEQMAAIRRNPEPINSAEKEGKIVIISPEQQLMGFVIAWPEIRPMVFAAVKSEYILVDNIKTLYNVVHGLVGGLESSKEGGVLPADQLLEKIPSDQLPLAEGLRRLSEEIAGQSQVSVEKETMVLIQAVKRRFLERELAVMQNRLAEDNKGEREELLLKFKDLRQELSRVSL
jgi:hypothetical protein